MQKRPHNFISIQHFCQKSSATRHALGQLKQHFFTSAVNKEINLFKPQWWFSKVVYIVSVKLTSVSTDIMQQHSEASDKHALIATMSVRSRELSNNPQPNQHVPWLWGRIPQQMCFHQMWVTRWEAAQAQNIYKLNLGVPLFFWGGGHPNYRCCTIHLLLHIITL